jgi:hypothetical protein
MNRAVVLAGRDGWSQPAPRHAEAGPALSLSESGLERWRRVRSQASLLQLVTTSRGHPQLARKICPGNGEAAGERRFGKARNGRRGCAPA